MQDMLHQLGKHGKHHIHRHESLLLETIGTDQNDIRSEQHHDQVLGPNLRAVEQAAQNDLANDNGKDTQHQNRKDVAQNVIYLVDTFADTFDNFHRYTSLTFFQGR